MPLHHKNENMIAFSKKVKDDTNSTRDVRHSKDVCIHPKLYVLNCDDQVIKSHDLKKGPVWIVRARLFSPI